MQSRQTFCNAATAKRNITLLMFLMLFSGGPVWAATPGDTLLIRCDADVYCRPDADAPVCSEAFAWNQLYIASASHKPHADFYPASLKPGGVLLGWVRKSDAAVWPHRVAVGVATGVQQAEVHCTADDVKAPADNSTAACWMQKSSDPFLPVLQPVETATTTDAPLRVMRMQRRFATPPTAAPSETAPRDPAAILPPFQHAAFEPSRVPVLPALLDVVFVIQAGQPHKTIRAIGSAVEAWLPKSRQTVDARIGIAVIGSDGRNAPLLYSLNLTPQEFTTACKTHNSSEEPPAPVASSATGPAMAVLTSLQQITAQAAWRESSRRHIVLLAPDKDAASCDKKNAVDDAAATAVLNALQPEAGSDITLHIATTKELCGVPTLQLTAGNNTPGTFRKYRGGVLTELLSELTSGLNRQPPFPPAIYAVSAPAAVAAALPPLRQAPPWSPRYTSTQTADTTSPGKGYIARASRTQSSSFEAYVLVEHRELTMFASYLEFTVNGLRRLDSGSEEVARTLANMQRFEVNLFYGRPLSSPAAGPSGFAAELEALPVKTRVLSATAARLASMSQTDYSNWIKQAARCQTAIRKLLDNKSAWSAEGAYGWLPVSDLP